jgi:hypothetical protein
MSILNNEAINIATDPGVKNCPYRFLSAFVLELMKADVLYSISCKKDIVIILCVILYLWDVQIEQIPLPLSTPLWAINLSFLTYFNKVAHDGV